MHLKYVAGVLALLAAGSFMLGTKEKALWKTIIGVLWLGLAALGAVKFAEQAKSTIGKYDTFFEVAAPMVSANS